MYKSMLSLALLATPSLLLAESSPTLPAAPNGLPTLFKVGSDAACSHATIVDALNAAGVLQNVVVRVAKNAVPQQGTVTAREQLTIEGGYDTCSDTTASGRSTINGTGATGSVLRLTNAFTNGTDYNVFLRNLKISGGVGAASPVRGGGLTIDGPLAVYLDNTLINFNATPENGGGIYIKGQLGDAGAIERTQLIVFGNSSIDNNDAKRGGGIACEEKVSVRIFDASVSNNDVTEVGGGLYSLGCYTTVYENQPGFAYGISNNGASGILTAGGGIYADSSFVFLRGGLSGPARVVGNIADLGAGIYLRNDAKLYAYDSDISGNTAFTGGGVFAENSTTVIARTKAGANCYDELRCSRLSDNWATAPGSTTGGGGGAVFADGGTTRISGTFMEKNRAFGGRGMAVRAINAPGTDTGFDQNGLRVLGSVVAESTNDGGAVEPYESVIEFSTSSGVIGFTTFARNSSVPNIIYTPSTAIAYEIDVYGSIFDASTGNVAGPGVSGPIPNGDCNRLHETTSTFSINSARSTTLSPEFVDAANDDYRLGGGLNMVDWCDASYNVLTPVLTADGGPRPYDDPDISAEFGNYDLGGLERHPSDLIFRNGFQAF